MQHIAVEAAQVVSPNDPDWEKTATGRLYSYKYGFGKVDAYQYVTTAMDWSLVKPQAWLDVPPVRLNNGMMDEDEVMSGGDLIVPGGISSSLTITTEMMNANNFEALEHVTVRVWIAHDRRGDVEVELVSPNGIKSVLAARRDRDIAATGFPGWRFMSVKHW
jgi:kexin